MIFGQVKVPGRDGRLLPTMMAVLITRYSFPLMAARLVPVTSPEPFLKRISQSHLAYQELRSMVASSVALCRSMTDKIRTEEVSGIGRRSGIYLRTSTNRPEIPDEAWKGKLMMQAVYIDTRSSCGITVHAVWVTRASSCITDGIVIREAAKLPSIPKKADLYLIDATGYRDEHCTDVIHGFAGRSAPAFEIWGEAMIGNKLQSVTPHKVYAISGGVYGTIETHTVEDPDVAQTARDMLTAYYQYQQDHILILEWGDKYTNACKIEGKIMYNLELPIEDRTDIINRIAVEATRSMLMYSDSEELETLRYMMRDSLAALMGAKLKPLDVSNDVATEIVRRLAEKGVTPLNPHCWFEDEKEADVVQRARDIIKEIAPVQFVVAYRDEDEERLHKEDEDLICFTWSVPSELEDQIKPGDRIIVSGYPRDFETTVSRVFRGSDPCGEYSEFVKKIPY